MQFLVRESKMRMKSSCSKKGLSCPPKVAVVGLILIVATVKYQAYRFAIVLNLWPLLLTMKTSFALWQPCLSTKRPLLLDKKRSFIDIETISTSSMKASTRARSAPPFITPQCLIFTWELVCHGHTSHWQIIFSNKFFYCNNILPRNFLLHDMSPFIMKEWDQILCHERISIPAIFLCRIFFLTLVLNVDH